MTINQPTSEDFKVAAAHSTVDAAWDELQRGIHVQHKLGIKPQRLPSLFLDDAKRRSAVGESLLRRIEEVGWDGLPHDLGLTLRVVAFRARTWAQEAKWYWTVIDPLGVGMFGIFLPTPYCGGSLLTLVHDQLS
jgi:hypothetical protein